MTTVTDTHDIFLKDFLEEVTFEQGGKGQGWAERDNKARRCMKLSRPQHNYGHEASMYHIRNGQSAALSPPPFWNSFVVCVFAFILSFESFEVLANL